MKVLSPLIILLFISSSLLAQEENNNPFEVIELDTYTLSDSDLVRKIGETDAQLNHGVFISFADPNSSYIAFRLNDKKWHEFEVDYDASTIRIEQYSHPQNWLKIAPAQGEPDRLYHNDRLKEECDNIIKPGKYIWKEGGYEFSEDYPVKKPKKRKK